MATEQDLPARDLEYRAFNPSKPNDPIMLQYPEYIKYHTNDGYKLQQKVDGVWVDAAPPQD